MKILFNDVLNTFYLWSWNSYAQRRNHLSDTQWPIYILSWGVVKHPFIHRVSYYVMITVNKMC